VGGGLGHVLSLSKGCIRVLILRRTGPPPPPIRIDPELVEGLRKRPSRQHPEPVEGELVEGLRKRPELVEGEVNIRDDDT
jgi:hypothetical protein